MTFLLVLAIIIILAPLVSAAARRLERPALPGASSADVARLREELDQLTAQVNRLQDEQSFMIRLLSDGERSAAGPRLGRVDREASDAGHQVGTGESREVHRPEPQTPDGGP
jgi:hypothetical protein